MANHALLSHNSASSSEIGALDAGIRGAMLISRRPPKRPLQVVLTPFHSSDAFLEARPSALVFLSDPDEAPTPRSSILKSLYGTFADGMPAGGSIDCRDRTHDGGGPAKDYGTNGSLSLESNLPQDRNQPPD